MGSPYGRFGSMGDQAKGMTNLTPLRVRLRSPLPSAFMTWSSSPEGRWSRSKAIICPSGDQRGAPVVPRIARQPPLLAPVGVHDVDLVVAGAVAEEDDLPPVGRPGGVRSELGGNSRIAWPGFQQPPLPAPVRVDDVEPDVSTARSEEGDLRLCRRRRGGAITVRDREKRRREDDGSEKRQWASRVATTGRVRPLAVRTKRKARRSS